jgi:ABC-type uncharacterized transport system permease subunit
MDTVSETSVLWLRVAAGLYSIGLIYAILTLVQRRRHLYQIALGAFALGGVFHFVSIVDQAIAAGHFPASNIFESLSLCAFAVTGIFLVTSLRYPLESLSAFIFPLVFMMTLAAALSTPVGNWTSPVMRNAWLIAHVVAALMGYAALTFAAVAALLYLYQERQLKQKAPDVWTRRLPPLGTLDEIISRSIAAGFAFVTAGMLAGTVWAFVEFGTKWVTNPSIGLAYVTWSIYLALVFFRAGAGWRGRKAAILALIALGCSAMTWAAHSRLEYMLNQ